MKNLFNNLFGKKAQSKVETKQLFQNCHETIEDSQSIISDMQKDVQILIELTEEMRVTCDKTIEFLDKSIAKYEEGESI